MKKLLREQMKNVKGGFIPEEGGRCAKAGASCYFSGGSAAKTCCKGLTCTDQGNETGSLCG